MSKISFSKVAPNDPSYCSKLFYFDEISNKAARAKKKHHFSESGQKFFGSSGLIFEMAK